MVLKVELSLCYLKCLVGCHDVSSFGSKRPFSQSVANLTDTFVQCDLGETSRESSRSIFIKHDGEITLHDAIKILGIYLNRQIVVGAKVAYLA